MESIKQGRRLKPSLNPLKKKCEYLNYFHLQQAWANLKETFTLPLPVYGPEWNI
jgi:hypothetical protein